MLDLGFPVNASAIKPFKITLEFYLNRKMMQERNFDQTNYKVDFQNTRLSNFQTRYTLSTCQTTVTKLYKQLFSTMTSSEKVRHYRLGIKILDCRRGGVYAYKWGLCLHISITRNIPTFFHSITIFSFFSLINQVCIPSLGAI